MMEIIGSAMRSGIEVMAWDLINDHLINFKMKIKKIIRGSEEILLVPADKAMDWDSVKELVRGSGLMNFFISEPGLLFRSELLALEGDFLVIRFPKIWNLEDRRIVDRISELNSIVLEIRKKDNIRAFKVFDISEGGLSVVLSGADSYHLKEGDRIKGAILKLMGTAVSLDIEVINGQKVTPYQFENIPYTGRRFGIQFSKRSEVVSKLISDFKKQLGP